MQDRLHLTQKTTIKTQHTHRPNLGLLATEWESGDRLLCLGFGLR